MIWTNHINLMGNVLHVFTMKMRKKISHSGVRLFVTPRTVVHQARPWNSPDKNTGVGCHFSSLEDLPDPEIESRSSALWADSLPSEPPRKPIQASQSIRFHHEA